MNPSESFQALRRANPRRTAGFAQSVEVAADAVRAQIATLGSDVVVDAAAPAPRTGLSRSRRRLVGLSAAGASLAAASAVAVFLTVASPGGGPGVEDAAAAVRRAAADTAASAARSGTAVVRISRNGELWAGTTIRWHDDDLVVARGVPRRPGRPGSELRVVDGTLYGRDPRRGWVVLGSPDSIDPGSGTTPDEYLAAVREDVGARRCAGSPTA